MINNLDILEEKDEKKKVGLCHDKYGLDLMIMRNGENWSSIPVDDDLLKLISKVIDSYFVKINKKQKLTF